MHIADFVAYRCVSPRDLFNQAKLLKCLGKLCLMHLDMKHPALDNLKIMDPPLGVGYVIGQDQGSGDIACTSLRFELNGEVLVFSTSLNCREPWPLEVWDSEEDTSYEVFSVKDDHVGLSAEFVQFLERG